MDSRNSQPHKETRAQVSLAAKLTFLEVMRRLWLLICINVLIVVLFLLGLIVYVETDVTGFLNRGLTHTVIENYEIIEQTGKPDGFKLDFSFNNKLYPQFNPTYRNFWFDKQITSFSNGEFFEWLESFHYSIAIPKNDAHQSYWVCIFSDPLAVRVFMLCFEVLLFLEAVGLFIDGFKIRSSIRRSLRPIYDLTLIAQNMNVGVNPVIALPGSEELHLSGAIDTLNNITEDNLSRRIVISDEREELRGLAEAINAMLDRLDSAYRSQLRFVSDASHELRTPIAVIQGYANMLDRWGKNDIETLQESIDAIKSEAGGMQDLVEQLLFLARTDNRSIVLRVETVDTFALADEVLRETQMIDPNHEFGARLTEGLSVRGDLQLLKQALRIFADNAIKYTPNGGKITFSTVSEDGYAKISVSDTGIGIPEQDLERVFDRFFRSDESRTRGTGGTGLGLSIAKWIIDRHGGFVEIISREDFGTKVTISLPILNDSVAFDPKQ